MSIFGNQRSESVKEQIGAIEKERDTLNDSLLSVRNQLAELRQKRKMEDENIRHLVKIKEEGAEIAFQKKTVELERQQQEAIARVKDDYRDKQESTLKTQIESGDKRFKEILSRLPNVQVRLKGDI